MGDLKQNDIFRMGKASQADSINETQWYVSDSNAEKIEGSTELSVSATPISFIRDESYRVSENFKYAPASLLKKMRGPQEETTDGDKSKPISQ